MTSHPSPAARIAVGGITHQRQIVRDRLRRHAKLLDYARLIHNDARTTIQLNDARSLNTLGKVLVRGTDDHLFDTWVANSRHCSRSKRVVRLEFHHGLTKIH